MLESIEEHFAAQGRTPKGRKALVAIFRATHDLMVQRGVEGTSLEDIAHGAGLTQAALRHYFGTREELLTAFFLAATRWFRAQAAGLLMAGDLPAREQLERCVSWHLEYMEQVDTALWLESSAYWLRHPPPRQLRNDFYRWLVRQYAALIARAQPALPSRECQRRGYALLTLVLGAWTTHGRGSAVGGAGGVRQQRQLLIDVAMAIVTR